MPYLRRRGPKNEDKRRATQTFGAILEAFDARYPGATHVDIAVAVGIDKSTVHRYRST